MHRSPRLLAIATTWAIVSTASLLAPAGFAAADPTPAAPCDYTLTAPHVVRVSGTDMVTASISPAACARANVYLSVACVQVQGSQEAARCEQNNGPLVAQVFFAPYQPGATYVSTGRGCATTGNPPQPVCQPVGPFTATL
jgi:hypothetical protein